MYYKPGDMNYVYCTHDEKLDRLQSIHKFIEENPIEDVGIYLRHTESADMYLIELLKSQQKSIEILLKRIEYLEEDMNNFDFKVCDYLHERDLI